MSPQSAEKPHQSAKILAEHKEKTSKKQKTRLKTPERKPKTLQFNSETKLQ